jgi:hypothetical protein
MRPRAIGARLLPALRGLLVALTDSVRSIVAGGYFVTDAVALEAEVWPTTSWIGLSYG